MATLVLAANTARGRCITTTRAEAASGVVHFALISLKVRTTRAVIWRGAVTLIFNAGCFADGSPAVGTAVTLCALAVLWCNALTLANDTSLRTDRCRASRITPTGLAVTVLELRRAAVSVDATWNTWSKRCGTLRDRACLTVPAMLTLASRIQVVIRHASAVKTSLGTIQLGAILQLPSIFACTLSVTLLFRAVTGASAMTGASDSTRRARRYYARAQRAFAAPVKLETILAVVGHVKSCVARALASTTECTSTIA